jgi:SAM-dependent methyltransferase
VRWGNVLRRRPFSEQWGTERGTPIDRVFIEAFLAEHRRDVRGRVLEVKEVRYATTFGTGVTSSHVVDIDPKNAAASIVADLAVPSSLPAQRFDCAIITQTLQFVSDLDAALRNIYDALAPGGVALITMPAVSRLEVTLASEERWRVLPRGLEALIARSCPGSTGEVRGYGGLPTCLGFLLSLGAEELDRSDLDHHDEHFPLLVAARIERPSRAVPAEGPLQERAS